MHLLAEGNVLTMFRFSEYISPTPVDKQIFQLVMQDEARHVCYGMQHLKWIMDHAPEQKEQLHRALDEGENVTINQFDAALTECMIVLAGKGTKPEQIAEGVKIVGNMQAEADHRVLPPARARRLRRPHPALEVHADDGGPRDRAGGQGGALKQPLRGALATASLLALAALACQAYVARFMLPREGIRAASCGVRIERQLELTTADGVVLRADVYHPEVPGPVPTILVRIPLTSTFLNDVRTDAVGRFWASRGYTVVIQGTRGRHHSEGAFYPLRGERSDGIDTLRWLARQPWFDGRLGMWGASAFGHTQWVLADQSDPGPQALMIQIASTDFFGMFHPGGAFSLESALYWARAVTARKTWCTRRARTWSAALPACRSSRPTTAPSATSTSSTTGSRTPSVTPTGRRSTARRAPAARARRCC